MIDALRQHQFLTVLDRGEALLPKEVEHVRGPGNNTGRRTFLFGCQRPVETAFSSESANLSTGKASSTEATS